MKLSCLYLEINVFLFAYSANQYPFSSGSTVHAYLQNTYHKDGSYSCYKGSCFTWTWWWGLRYIGYRSNQSKDTPTYSTTTTLLYCTTTTQKYSHLDTNRFLLVLEIK